MDVPIADPIISNETKRRITDVLESGMIASGEKVDLFEREFADYCESKYAVATSSGTTALHAMFEAAGIGDSDAVITTPFSFISSANAIVHAGAKPVFADIDPETYNLDPEAVRNVLEQRENVAALMPVHLYGLPADLIEFRRIADEYDLLLFEDAAQAHGAQINDCQVGSLSDAGAFSFYPTKNMTTGEGGMVVTDNAQLAERLRKVINHGRSGQYHHEFIGYNFRMTNLQAAIGREQLTHLEDWIRTRRETAAALTEGLSLLDPVMTPTEPENMRHAYHQYTIRVDHRDSLRDYLNKAGIGNKVYYPTTIPDQPAYDQSEAYPIARMCASSVLSLPVHPRVDADDVESIVAAVQEWSERQ